MPDPSPLTVGDALLRAADRDGVLAEQLLKLLQLVDALADDLVAVRRELGDARRDLDAERLMRERLELRVLSRELRDDGLPLLAATAGAGEHLADVVPLIREYAPDTEPLPTTDDPT